MVTIRQLRAFAETYRTRNLTHAANSLHVTQAAVSALIRQFEESLGVQLFERTPRAVRPTKAADEAITSVDEILAKILELHGKMKIKAQAEKKVLSFSCVPALTTLVTPHVIAQFRDLMPDVAVSVIDMGSPSLLEPVLSEQCEFNISPFPYECASVRSHPLLTEPACVLHGLNSKFSSMEHASWEDLSDQRIIGLAKDKTLQNVARRHFAGADKDLKTAYDVEFIQSALALTAYGMGVMIGPAFLMKWSPHANALQATRLVNPEVEQCLLVHTRHNHVLSEPAQQFLKLFREHVVSLG